MADRAAFVKEAVTGGGVLSLDGIATSDIEDGDICFTMSSGVLYFHKFNASSTAAASGIAVVRPTDFTVAGVWEIFPIHDQLAIPVGGYLDVSGEDAPDGYLVADGAAYSRTTYEALYNYYSADGALPAMYGDGDGVTTFNVPDCRGKGRKSLDNGAGVDLAAASRTDRGDGTTGDAVGTNQPSMTARPSSTAMVTDTDSHSHPLAGFGYGTGDSGSSLGVVKVGGSPVYTQAYSHNHSISSGGDVQTNMVNMYDLRCVKY